MKFTFTYESTSWNDCYKPYYFINDRRVSGDYFVYMISYCKFTKMNYNNSSLIIKNKRYKSTFYYD